MRIVILVREAPAAAGAPDENIKPIQMPHGPEAFKRQAAFGPV